MIPLSRPAHEPQPSLPRDLFHLARYYLGGRRGLLVIAGVALVAGLTLNWGWLTAAGIAPILISLLPCAAMSALGLCMNRAAGKSCSTGVSTPDTAATASAAPEDRADALEASPATPIPQIPGDTVAVPLADAEPQPSKERNTTDA